MTDSRFALGVLATISLAGAGCTGTGSGASTGTVGEAGNGVFHYVCLDEGDAVCAETAAVDPAMVVPDLGSSGQLPRSIAVSGRFDLSYYGGVPEQGGSALPVEIVPARTDVVHTTGGFSFSSPATVAFLARNPQGITVDFIHVTASTATALTLWSAAAPVAELALAQPGAEAMLAVVPSDADGISLGGALGYEWHSSDEAIVRLSPVGSTDVPVAGLLVRDDEVRLVGIAEGQATVRVVVGSLSQEVAVSVAAEVTP
jgi:hypothetical protein